MNEESMNGSTSIEKVLQAIEDSPVKVGQHWRHYKGEVYVIHGFAINEPTTDPLVLYYRDGLANVITDGVVPWSRRLSDFRGYVEGARLRFTIVETK